MAPLYLLPPGKMRVLDWRREKQAGAGWLQEVEGFLAPLYMLPPWDVEGPGGRVSASWVLGSLQACMAPRWVRELYWESKRLRGHSQFLWSWRKANTCLSSSPSSSPLLTRQGCCSSLAYTGTSSPARCAGRGRE